MPIEKQYLKSLINASENGLTKLPNAIKQMSDFITFQHLMSWQINR